MSGPAVTELGHREPGAGSHLRPAPDLAAEIIDASRALARAAARAASATSAAPRLTGAQLEVLLALSRTPGATVSGLAEGLRRAPNTISTVLGQLGRLDLVERSADPADARVVRVHLTEGAVERMAAWRARQAAAVTGALESLSAEQRAAVAAAVGPIRALAGLVDATPS